MIKKPPNLTLKRVWMWDIWILTVSLNCLLIWWCLLWYEAFSEESPPMNQTPKCETFSFDAFVCENYSYQISESCFSPFIPGASEGKRLREYHVSASRTPGAVEPISSKALCPRPCGLFTWLEMFHEGDNKMICKKLNAWPHTRAAVIYTPEKC